MKRSQRQRWLCLDINTPLEYVGFSLCNMCRHAQWSGYACQDPDLECHCGIEKVEENAFEVWSGSDCWAFRPKYIHEDVVDALGMALQGIYPDWATLRTVGEECTTTS